MKRAQYVAQAVVKTRSSISLWTCMGPRRRVVSPTPTTKIDDLHAVPLITERESESTVREVRSSNLEANNVEYHFQSSSESEIEQNETDEDEDIIQEDSAVTTSTIEEVTEGQLWFELEKELQRQESEVDARVQEEEEAAAKEITEEEKVYAGAVEDHTPVSTSDVSDELQLYPPGQLMHMISSAPSSEPGDDDMPVEEHIGIYETPRELYSKLRLSRTMINDHYMPMYKKMMELLIKRLEDELDNSCVAT